MNKLASAAWAISLSHKLWIARYCCPLVLATVEAVGFVGSRGYMKFDFISKIFIAGVALLLVAIASFLVVVADVEAIVAVWAC